MDDRQRAEERACERERELYPRGNRLSIVPMTAANLGHENQETLPTKPTTEKGETK